MLFSLSAEDLHWAIITPGLYWISLLRVLTFPILMFFKFQFFFIKPFVLSIVFSFSVSGRPIITLIKRHISIYIFLFCSASSNLFSNFSYIIVHLYGLTLTEKTTSYVCCVCMFAEDPFGYQTRGTQFRSFRNKFSPETV